MTNNSYFKKSFNFPANSSRHICITLGNIFPYIQSANSLLKTRCPEFIFSQVGSVLDPAR